MGGGGVVGVVVRVVGFGEGVELFFYGGGGGGGVKAQDLVMACDFGEMGGGGVEVGGEREMVEGMREIEERARDMEGRG